jgi:PE-PPE domain-containing protein
MLLGTAAAALIGLSSAFVSGIAIAATTALIMGGTSNPLSIPPQDQGFIDGYVAGANQRYVQCGVGCTVVGAVTPEEFVPVNGTLTFNQSVYQGRANLDNCIEGRPCTFTRTFPLSGTTTGALPADTYKVFGYSQSAAIATLEKRRLAATYDPGEGPDVTFDVVGNPDRPNGGFLARGLRGITIPFLDVTFFGAMPTNTQYETTDTARQYDGWADGPVNPLNILADINALVGIGVVHGDYFSGMFGAPILQDQVGDTSYYLIPTKTLPMLSWLNQIPTVGPFVAAVLDAPLRVIVEGGYDRTRSPGDPTGWNFLYTPNPIKFAVDLIRAMPTGWDDAISQAAGIPSLRPFGTKPAGPYGVGGPPVTMNPTTTDQTQQSTIQAVNDTDSPATDSKKAATTVKDAEPQSLTSKPAADVVDAPVTKTDPSAAKKPDADTTDADTTDADPPKAKKPDADAAAADATAAKEPDADTIAAKKPPKVRKPKGADHPAVSDPAPAGKRTSSKTAKKDAAGSDDTAKGATKASDSEKAAA